MLEFLTPEVMASIGYWVEVGLAFVGASALVAAKFGGPSANKYLNYIKQALNFLGANFGKAKNKV